jgi:hypothetical protein
MLMVIFGAGASFDSSPTYPAGSNLVPPSASDVDRHNGYNRLPLAKELFANRPLFIDALNAFPECKAIVPRLRGWKIERGDTSIETVLQEIDEESYAYPPALQELSAVRCYLQRAICNCEIQWNAATAQINNYLTLLREIHRTYRTGDPVCLVTFNYDTLLEDALHRLGMGINKMEDYTQRNVLFRLFKLHGSVNWARRPMTALPENINRRHAPSVLGHLIKHSSQMNLSELIERCEPTSMEIYRNGGVGFPAIAIPLERKTAFECPKFMIDDFKSVLPQVSKILTIGWRATEAHFLSLLKECLKPGIYIHVVGATGEDAEGIRVRIQDAMVKNAPSSVAVQVNGFTEFVRQRRIERIIEM